MTDQNITTAGIKSARFVWLAVLIATIAFGIRLIATWQATPLFNGDEPEYVDLAKNLLENGKFISTERMQPWCQGGKPGDPTAYRSPVFPFFLAVHFKLFGTSYLWPKLSLILVSSAICIMLAYLGRLVGEARAGLLAAVIWAVNPPSIFGYYSSEKLVVEGFGTFLLVGAFTVLAMLYSHDRASIACLSGLLLGLSILSRGYLLFIFPLCVISLALFPLRRRWRTMAVFTITTAVVIGGWIIRNWAVMGKPVLSTQTEHFYLGNNLWARGSLYADVFVMGFDAPQLKVIKERYPTVMEMSEVERSEMWSNEAIKSIAESPKRFAWLLMRKTILFWLSLRPDLLSWYRWHYLYGFALLFAIPVFIGSKWKKSRRSLLFLLAPVIGVYLSTLMTYSFNRYRFTIEPFVFLLGAVGCVGIVRWLMEWRKSLRLLA